MIASLTKFLSGRCFFSLSLHKAFSGKVWYRESSNREHRRGSHKH